MQVRPGIGFIIHRSDEYDFRIVDRNRCGRQDHVSRHEEAAWGLPQQDTPRPIQQLPPHLRHPVHAQIQQGFIGEAADHQALEHRNLFLRTLVRVQSLQCLPHFPITNNNEASLAGSVRQGIREIRLAQERRYIVADPDNCPLVPQILNPFPL